MQKIYPVLVLTVLCLLSCNSGDENTNSALEERREMKCIDSGGDYYEGVCYCGDDACDKGRACDIQTGQCQTQQSLEEMELESSCNDSGGDFKEGVCFCSEEPCEDNVVCDPDTLECAEDVVPQDPDPQESDPKEPTVPADCVSSGGVLIQDMCFCNGNLCDPGIFCNEIGICSNRNAKIEAACTSTGGVYQDGSCVCNGTKCSSGIYCSEAGICSNQTVEITPQISEECKDNNDYWCQENEVFHCEADSSGDVSAKSFLTCEFGCSEQNRLKPKENGQYTKTDIMGILCRECSEDLYRCEGNSFYTCESGKIAENSCVLNDKPVSCKNNKECGQCLNDEHTCSNVTLNDGLNDNEIGIKTKFCTEGEWQNVDISIFTNDNPNISTLLNQFSCNYNSCRSDGKCGVCMNGSKTCSNNGNQIGTLRECADGSWKDIESCINVSCNVSKCGECVNDAISECALHCTDGSDNCDNSKKSYLSGVCVYGKWVYSKCTP